MYVYSINHSTSFICSFSITSIIRLCIVVHEYITLTLTPFHLPSLPFFPPSSIPVSPFLSTSPPSFLSPDPQALIFNFHLNFNNRSTTRAPLVKIQWRYKMLSKVPSSSCCSANSTTTRSAVIICRTMIDTVLSFKETRLPR